MSMLYGRKWLLEIVCNDGTKISFGKDGFDGEEALRCVFDVNYPGYEGWTFSTFNIWNMYSETEKKIIEEGADVYFSAGYTGKGPYGLLFSGKVFQSLYTRENVTDYKLTLSCMDGERLFKDNYVAFTLKDYTDQTLANAIASRAFYKIPVGLISENISTKPRYRAVTVFGRPDVPLRELARGNMASMFMKDGELNMCCAEDALKGSAIPINSTNGLVGSPIQMDKGVRFRTLLNPKLVLSNPLSWVKLDMSSLNIVEQRRVPLAERVPVIPKDGYFSIGGVRHTGDTRGDDWYTDVIGYGVGGAAGLEMTLPSFLGSEDEDPT